MKSSKRLRRIQRQQKAKKQPVLNLVSLMDIFTILVFFLLVNSSSTQQLPRAKELTLPTTIAAKAPKESLIITITKHDVLVQGVKVSAISDVLSNNADIILPLKKELEYRASQSSMAASASKSVTIMGDENMPYDLISKILKTCQLVNYRQIAFAAHEKAKSKS